jgi:hypothetical protein
MKGTLIYMKHNKIVCLVNVFESRRKAPGPFYRESLEAADTLVFEGIYLHRKKV